MRIMTAARAFLALCLALAFTAGAALAGDKILARHTATVTAQNT